MVYEFQENRRKVKGRRHNPMKRYRLAIAPVFIGCAILVLTQIGFAQEQKIDKDAEKPGSMVIELVVSSATVDTIDYEKRSVTVKLPDGTAAQLLKAGPEVKNGVQRKVDDPDHNTFVESIAVFMRTANAPARAKPENAVPNTLLLIAKVDAIDHTHRTITLKSPQGNLKTLSVGRDVTNFILMKEGDKVVVRSREPLAITSETSQKQTGSTVTGELREVIR
jgi:hypothetical protein